MGREPPPARAMLVTTEILHEPSGTEAETALRSDSACSSTASTGAVSICKVGICSCAFSGSRYRRRVASSAAMVILSRRRARANGFFFKRSIRHLLPMMPACGPPSSLSPEKETRSHPSSASVTVGSPYPSRPRKGRSIPEPRSSYTRRSSSPVPLLRSFSRAAIAPSSFASTDSVKPIRR